MKQKNTVFILCLLAVVSIFIFLRFYNIQQRFAFAWDQENISNEAYKILVNKKISLLGPRANNDLGFYLGPYFTFLITPFFALTHLHPNALILFVFINALLFIYLSIYVISSLFSRKIAILFLFIWGINISLINNDITAWWPVLIPNGILLFLLLTHKIYKEDKLLNSVYLGLLCGFFTNMHFQFSFVTLAAILVPLLKNSSLRRKITFMLLFTISFLVTLLPLLFFDLRHDFLNLNLFLNFFFGKSHSQLGGKFFALTPVVLNIVKSIFPTNNQIVLILCGLIISALPIYFVNNQKKSFERQLWLIVSFLYMVTIVGFMIYGKRPSEYYFLFLMPFIILSICKFAFTNIYTKVLLALFIVWNILGNSMVYFTNLTVPPYLNMQVKEKTILEIKKIVKNKSVNVGFDVPLGQDNGFRYLMKVHDLKESGNMKDPMIGVNVPPKKNDILIDANLGIRVPKELK